MIPVESARGTIWGQGLVASDKWDSYIDIEDTLSGIDITRRIGVASIDDTVYINKTSLELEGITWGYLEDSELTWGEVEDDHLW